MNSDFFRLTNKNFQLKKNCCFLLFFCCFFFHIFSNHIDCGYTLELPWCISMYDFIQMLV